MDHTANAWKLIEKYVIDLRNIFLSQESIRKVFSKQLEENLTEKIFLFKKLYLDSRKFSQNKNNFLKMRNIFFLRKIILT